MILQGVGVERQKRHYRPRLEALEALRLLDHGVAAALGPGLIEAFEPALPSAKPESTSSSASVEAWDAALDAALVDDWLAPESTALAIREPATDALAIEKGLDQLSRYLGCAWARAGIAPQHFEDCTQTVYITLLENLGRDGFDHLANDVGRHGVRETLSWETPEGPDFFRAVDMVKKRTQRLKRYQSLEDHEGDLTTRASTTNQEADDWRATLREVIENVLSPREAELIRETMRGKTPAEIASQWGVAPKTVSNEKSRALGKLRESLSAAFVEA